MREREYGVAAGQPAPPWDTLLISVALYIVIPVIVAQLWRRALLRRGQAAFDRALERIGPLSIAALLLTLVLLFAFQGEAIIRQPRAPAPGRRRLGPCSAEHGARAGPG